MAVRNHNRPIALYGISDAISGGAPEPIIANRAPQTNDIAALGTAWILPGSEEIWFLTEVKGNVATWTTFFGNVASVTAGTGINLTGTAQNPIINLTVPVTIAHGGTNATSMTNTDGVVYFDGTSLVTTTVGTAGQVLTSNGAGVAPTFQAVPASGITLTGDSGGALGPSSSFTIVGGNNQKVAGSGTTLTVHPPSNIAAFNFYASSNQTGVTGDGTPYQVLFDTQAFQNGSNFASSTFTAPVNGFYMLMASVSMFNINPATHTGGSLAFVITGGTRNTVNDFNPGAMCELQTTNNFLTMETTYFVSLAATETVTVFLTITGGAATVNIGGSADEGETFFAGYLVA